MFYEVELIFERRISKKMFELVTQSVTSFCVTRFRNSILQLENSESLYFISHLNFRLFESTLLSFVKAKNTDPRNMLKLSQFSRNTLMIPLWLLFYFYTAERRQIILKKLSSNMIPISTLSNTILNCFKYPY